jgi:oligopeptide/dipeptide ABC transporter ATP-binding protein
VMLQADSLTKHYRARHGTVRAVDDVSFTIEQGQTFALVGESGCGKSTIAKLLLMLEQPTSGRVLFQGRDITSLDRRALGAYRREVQAVFQDPYASLNPRLRVGAIIAEPVLAHERPSRSELRRAIDRALNVVGLPTSAAGLYPHEFSGGQRQRIAIARALALRPHMIVLDEPVSALDVSIRAQVLNLLSDIQAEFGLTYLIIAHDLALVEHFSTQVAVIYLGQLVETGSTAEVFASPRHPYTRALLDAVPVPDPDRPLSVPDVAGEPASALEPPPGCRFQPRCPQAMSVCGVVPPPTAGTGHRTSCHLLTPRSTQ